MFVRGYCGRCQEYRSDNGIDAWKIVWRDGVGVCEKCGGVIDVWNNGNASNSTPYPADEEADNA